MIRFSLLAALMAGAFALPAAAADFGPRGHRGGPAIDFDAVDTAGTGSVDRAALEAHGIERVGTLDLDGDGSLDRDELAAAMPAPPAAALMPFAPDRASARIDRMLERFDAAEAGSVSVEAIVRRQVDAIMARLDRDGDGSLTRAEAEAPMAERGERRGPGGMRDGRPRD